MQFISAFKTVLNKDILLFIIFDRVIIIYFENNVIYCSIFFYIVISKCTNVDVNKPTSVDLYIVQCYKIGCLFGVFLLVFHSCFLFHDKHLWCVTMDIVSVVQWKQSISYWSLWYIYPINLFFPLMYEFLIIHFSFAKTAIYRKKIKIMFTWNIAHQSYIVYIRIITIQSGSVFVIFVVSLPQN